MDVSHWVVAIATGLSTLAWVATLPLAWAWARADTRIRRDILALREDSSNPTNETRADELLTDHSSRYTFVVYVPTLAFALSALVGFFMLFLGDDSRAVLSWPIASLVMAVACVLACLCAAIQGMPKSPDESRP